MKTIVKNNFSIGNRKTNIQQQTIQIIHKVRKKILKLCIKYLNISGYFILSTSEKHLKYRLSFNLLMLQTFHHQISQNQFGQISLVTVSQLFYNFNISYE